MIGSLRGYVIEKGPTWLLLEVGGIGYRIKTTPSVLSSLNNEEAFLYTHDHIREDAHDLFGFQSMMDLELFERLLGISGVGPKSALTIMSVGSADQVKQAIMSGDLAMLTSVPGVGKKTAQKIVLELKGQLVDPETGSSVDLDVIDALVGLGYSAQQSKDILKLVKATDPSEKIREALRYLSNA